tara:strand:+ start:571 stop:900 length:330 start_codon:yes stop_codon:yes gene_type:complete
MDLIENSKFYFEIFSNKKIELLEKIFSDEITLRDWENHVKGKDQVLQVNKNIFESVDSINVKPLNINADKNKIFAELEIEINNKDKILVFDIITFNEQGKITSIKAYKG